MENSQSSSKLPVMIVIILVLVLIGGYVLFNKNKTNTSVTTPAPSTALITDSNIPETNEKTTAISVSGTEFSFSPSTLTFQVGQPATVTFTNTGKMPHDFVVDEIPGAKTDIIKGGESTSITFTPTTAGTFKFYCSVGNHRAQGMEGTVTVQ
jgi:plastocyanin